MPSVNKAIIIGHLGRDPETRYLTNGDPVCNFSVATTESWKDKASGEKKEATEWHRIDAFGKLAEICGQYLKKGAAVYVEGKITTKEWTDKDGVKRYSTSIRADQMKMLGGKPEQDSQPQKEAAGAKPAGKFDDMEDDVPFISCELNDDVILKKLRQDRE